MRLLDVPLAPAISQVAWEVRLTPGDDAVDLQAGLGATPETRAWLAVLEPASLPEAWQRAASVARAWAKRRLPSAYPALFLEVDAPGEGPALPLLFPRIDAPDARAFLLAASAALHTLEPELPEDVPVRLARFLGTVPRGTTSVYACWLGNRGHDLVRWIGSVPRGALASWLPEAGWAGDADALSAEVDRLNPWSSHVPVGLDLPPEGLGPRVGVELFWARSELDDPRLLDALDHLAGWRELDDARVSAARRWALREGVPDAVAADLQLKAVFTPHGRSAKAYLGCWTPMAPGASAASQAGADTPRSSS